MTNTSKSQTVAGKTQRFYAVPAHWIMERRSFIGSLPVTHAELMVLLERLKTFWFTSDAALSVLTEDGPSSDTVTVRVEFEGPARPTARVAALMFDFYQDVNSDRILNPKD